MFCPHCGTNLPDDTKFCSSCGASLATAEAPQQAQPQYQQPEQQAYQQPQYRQPQQAYQQPQYQQPQQAYQQPQYQQQAYQQPQYQQQAYQQPQYQQPYGQPVYGAPAPMALTMKWFKFLIYFAMWASAVLNAFNAYAFFSDYRYTEKGTSFQKFYYSLFDGLQALDIVVGILCIVAAVIAIVTRFRLASFHKDGPKWLSMVYALNILISLVYVIGVIIVVENAAAPGANTEKLLWGEDSVFQLQSYVGTMIGGVLMIGLNGVYFKKRKHLFTK